MEQDSRFAHEVLRDRARLEPTDTTSPNGDSLACWPPGHFHHPLLLPWLCAVAKPTPRAEGLS
jgi:hypothetical protein